MDGSVGDTAFQQFEGVGELLETRGMHKGVSLPSFPNNLRLTISYGGFIKFQQRSSRGICGAQLNHRNLFISDVI